MKVGVMASEICKAIYDRPLDVMEPNDIVRAIRHTIYLLQGLNVECLEFCVSNSRSMSNLLRAFNELGLRVQLQVHDVENSVKLAYKNSDVRKEALEDLKTMIELASDNSVEIMTVHPAYYKPKYNNYIPSIHVEKSLDYLEGYEMMINALKELSTHASRYGITLGIENMECFSLITNKLLVTAHYGCKKSELLDIINKVNNPCLRITYDIGHANLTQEGPVEFCRGIVGLIVNVHVSDNSGCRDEHAPIGHGNIDFYNVFKTLADDGYNGPIIVERSYDDYLLEDIKTINDLLKRLNVLG